MTRFSPVLAFALLFTVATGHAVGLPDTGQDTCYNDSQIDPVSPGHIESISRDAGTHPRQDCRYGPDVAANFGMSTKTGAGPKGFDYTKIANNGATLAAGATLGTAAADWACTKDNITGLTWEVKTAASTDMRYWLHSYTWYNPLSFTNGGSAGSTGDTTSCSATLPGNLCNTQAYVAAVSAVQLCTYSDWRLPTRRELLTLINADGSAPSIPTTYFPNSGWQPSLNGPVLIWSGSTYVPTPAAAWGVEFNYGVSGAAAKTDSQYVLLVRGERF